MQKLKKQLNVALVAVMILSMMSMYAFTPLANAASLTDAKDTISDSDTGATNVTHVLTASTTGAFAAGSYLEATFPVGITGIAQGNVTCSDGMDATAVGQVVKCTSAAGTTNGLKTMTITNTANPAGPGSLTINLVTKTAGDVEIEKAQVKIYIIDNVTVTASVDASLTFAIEGLNAGTSVNGVLTTATTTAVTAPFGTLAANEIATVGQHLKVGTNASNGYTVTVRQNQELTSAAGAKINSFKDAAIGAGLATPEAWANPAGQLADANTWGHMGLTTNDADGAIGTAFSGSKYAGLAGAAPMAVMSHNGPSDELTQNVGIADVAFSTRITALQEAGDYTNTLTYVCTPQF